jgi:DNA transformation protein and related proteins
VSGASTRAFYQELLAPLGPITLTRMFGKIGVFCEGVMLGMIHDDALYLRVDDGNRALFAEATAIAPLDYIKGGKTIPLSFWRVPDRLFDDPDDLLVWARSGLAAAHRVSAGRTRNAKRSRVSAGRPTC